MLQLSLSPPGFTQNQYLDAPLRPAQQQTDAEQDDALQGSGIIVRQLGTSTLEEYRVSGRTRSVKVIPANGVPYYLIDADGDGEIGTGSDSETDGVTSWRIMNW
jgi:hypothetical protein